MLDCETYYSEAAALLDAKDFDKAREVLSRIIIATATEGERAHAYALRGWAWYQESEFESALEDFEVATALKPDTPNTLFLQARCREEMNDPAGALTDYEAVILLDPDVPDAWDGASMIHTFFGRTAEASRCAASAVKARQKEKPVHLR